MPSTLLVQGEYLHMGDLSPAFREKRVSQNVLLAPAVSHVPLIQNNQYAQMAYFRVVKSARDVNLGAVSLHMYRKP